MRILGIDPGIGRTGWGTISVKGGKLCAETYGCIETAATLPIGERLQQVFKEVEELIKATTPEVLAIEELFFNTNVKTAMVVGQARGVILLAASFAKLPVTVYTPLQVKIALTGYGRAEKKQVGTMVKAILHLDTIPKPDDTADALAIAITHAFSYKMK